jgi:hypothetical protein
MHPGTGHIVEFTVGRRTGKQDTGRAFFPSVNSEDYALDKCNEVGNLVA